MPLYLYECQYCEHKLEELQSFNDEPLKICPECGMEALEKQLPTNINFVLKGAGFFCNDYPQTPRPKEG